MEGLIRLEYFTSGLANGLTSNQVPGGLNRDYGRPFGEGLTAEDYQAGQHLGDYISFALGMVEVIQGGINAAGGLLLAPETLGASATISLAGAAMITHGLSTISNATHHLTEPETKPYQENHSHAKTKKPSLTDEHGRVQAKSSKGDSGKSNASSSHSPDVGVGKTKGTVNTVSDFEKIKSLQGKSVKWLARNKPKGWRKVSTKNNEGWIWQDEAGQDRLRFMRPNGKNASSSQWARQENGYLRWQNGKGDFLDVNGKVVQKTDPKFQEKTHIPYEGL